MKDLMTQINNQIVPLLSTIEQWVYIFILGSPCWLWLSVRERIFTFSFRFSCFLCDFHICNDCANNVCDEKKIENEKKIQIKIENLQTVVVSQEDEEEGLLDAMELSEEAFKVQDDIPLIDENPSLDDVSLIVEKIKINRPKFLHQGNLQGSVLHSHLMSRLGFHWSRGS